MVLLLYLQGGSVDEKLTGSGSVSSKVMLFNVNECSLINGGTYGIEESIITSMILAVTLTCIFVIMQKRGRDKL